MDGRSSPTGQDVTSAALSESSSGSGSGSRPELAARARRRDANLDPFSTRSGQACFAREKGRTGRTTNEEFARRRRDMHAGRTIRVCSSRRARQRGGSDVQTARTTCRRTGRRGAGARPRCSSSATATELSVPKKPKVGHADLAKVAIPGGVRASGLCAPALGAADVPAGLAGLGWARRADGRDDGSVPGQRSVLEVGRSRVGRTWC